MGKWETKLARGWSKIQAQKGTKKPHHQNGDTNGTARDGGGLHS